MLRILVKSDRMMIGAASAAVESASLATGLTFPFFLLLWRACFCGAIFIGAIAAACLEPSALSYACVALAVVFVEWFRRQSAALWRDSRKEWDVGMFNRYALSCMVKREQLFGMRLLIAFNLALVIAAAAAVRTAGAGGSLDVAVAVNAYLCAVIFAGGYVESSTPPLPIDGDRFTLAEPSAA